MKRLDKDICRANQRLVLDIMFYDLGALSRRSYFYCIVTAILPTVT